MTTHNDAPTVAAQQCGVTPAGAGELWVPAKPEHAKLGWTYDFEQTERIARAARDSTGYDAVMEVVEFVMAEADRRHRTALEAQAAELVAERAALRLAADRADRAEAQLAEAKKALEPFAKYASENGFGLNHKSEPLPDADGVGWVYLTNGDFRAARRTLTGGQEDGNG